jgi:transposase
VDTLTAMTVLSEVIDLRRFASPRELMAFIGLVPRERSSGGRSAAAPSRIRETPTCGAS